MKYLYELNCFNYNKEKWTKNESLSEFIHAAYVWSCALAVFVSSSFFYYLVTKTVLLDKYFASGWVHFSFNFKFIYIYKNKIETGSYQFALSFFYRISSIAVFFGRNAQEIYEETKQAYRLRARISLIKNCTITNIWMNMRFLFYFTVFFCSFKKVNTLLFIY